MRNCYMNMFPISSCPCNTDPALYFIVTIERLPGVEILVLPHFLRYSRGRKALVFSYTKNVTQLLGTTLSKFRPRPL